MQGVFLKVFRSKKRLTRGTYIHVVDDIIDATWEATVINDHIDASANWIWTESYTESVVCRKEFTSTPTTHDATTSTTPAEETTTLQDSTTEITTVATTTDGDVITSTTPGKETTNFQDSTTQLTTAATTVTYESTTLTTPGQETTSKDLTTELTTASTAHDAITSKTPDKETTTNQDPTTELSTAATTTMYETSTSTTLDKKTTNPQVPTTEVTTEAPISDEATLLTETEMMTSADTTTDLTEEATPSEHATRTEREMMTTQHTTAESMTEAPSSDEAALLTETEMMTSADTTTDLTEEARSPDDVTASSGQQTWTSQATTPEPTTATPMDNGTAGAGCRFPDVSPHACSPPCRQTGICVNDTCYYPAEEPPRPPCNCRPPKANRTRYYCSACGEPPQIPNTLLHMATCGETVRYTCLPGFTPLMGSITKVCQENGQWSGNDVICKAVEKEEKVEIFVPKENITEANKRNLQIGWTESDYRTSAICMGSIVAISFVSVMMIGLIALDAINLKHHIKFGLNNLRNRPTNIKKLRVTKAKKK